ncbi:MAG: hypothetical protein ACI840_000216 [Ulvibacter sp.]|jgi:hypothetical protein
MTYLDSVYLYLLKGKNDILAFLFFMLISSIDIDTKSDFLMTRMSLKNA